jgi:hypothetical protein
LELHDLASTTNRFKRGTLAIVCLGTMMLLLDIAVVNAALIRRAQPSGETDGC